MTTGTTRTHYQVLGVSRSAPPDTIRTAHRQLARVLHPDRQGESSDAERQLAERRMREVNAAWNVLSDPARRAEYDRSLRTGHATPSGAQRGTRRGSADRFEAGVGNNGHDSNDGHDTVDLEEFDPDEPEFTSLQYHVLRRGPLVAILLVAAILFVMTAYVGNAAREDDVSPSTTVPASRDCVRVLDPGGRTAVRTSCDEPSDGRIVTSVQQPLDCPARTRYVVLDGDIVCVTTDPSVTSNTLPDD